MSISQNSVTLIQCNLTCVNILAFVHTCVFVGVIGQENQELQEQVQMLSQKMEEQDRTIKLLQHQMVSHSLLFHTRAILTAPVSTSSHYTLK